MSATRAMATAAADSSTPPPAAFLQAAGTLSWFGGPGGAAAVGLFTDMMGFGGQTSVFEALQTMARAIVTEITDTIATQRITEWQSDITTYANWLKEQGVNLSARPTDADYKRQVLARLKEYVTPGHAICDINQRLYDVIKQRFALATNTEDDFSLAEWERCAVWMELLCYATTIYFKTYKYAVDLQIILGQSLSDPSIEMTTYLQEVVHWAENWDALFPMIPSKRLREIHLFEGDYYWAPDGYRMEGGESKHGFGILDRADPDHAPAGCVRDREGSVQNSTPWGDPAMGYFASYDRAPAQRLCDALMTDVSTAMATRHATIRETVARWRTALAAFKANLPPIAAPAPTIPDLRDRSQWLLRTPAGDWKPGTTVSYTVTFFNGNGSKTSDTTSFTVGDYAFPTLTLATDPFDTTQNRRIRRKIARDGVTLHEGDIGLVKDNTTTSYPDRALGDIVLPDENAARQAILSFDLPRHPPRPAVPMSGEGPRQIFEMKKTGLATWRARVGSYMVIMPMGQFLGPLEIDAYEYDVGQIMPIDPKPLG